MQPYILSNVNIIVIYKVLSKAYVPLRGEDNIRISPRSSRRVETCRRRAGCDLFTAAGADKALPRLKGGGGAREEGGMGGVDLLQWRQYLCKEPGSMGRR